MRPTNTWRNFRLTFLVSLSWLLCCAPADATGLGYNVRPSTSLGPPYPAPLIIIDVSHKPLSGPSTPLHELSVQMFDAKGGDTPDDTTPLQLLIVADDIEGELAVIDILGLSTPDDDFPAESFFDVFFEVNEPSTILDQELFIVDDFFDVFFDVEVNSNALHEARFQLPSGQPMEFVDPVVVPNAGGIHVQFGVRRNDGIPNQPLVSIAIHGHFIAVPEPSTWSMLALGLGLATVLMNRRKAVSKPKR